MDHTRSCYIKSEDNQAITPKELAERLEEHIEKIQRQVDINNAFSKSFLAKLEMNTLEKVESLKNSSMKLETDFLNLLQKQNQCIDGVVKREQDIAKMQKQVDDSLGNILARHDKIEKGKVEHANNTLNRVESVMKIIEQNIVKQSTTIELGLKNLENKMNTVLKNKQAQATVPSHFKRIGSKYYYISNNAKVNWFEAVAACRAKGGELVTFESKLEYEEVVKRLLQSEDYWTAINDLAKEGVYVSVATDKAAPFFMWLTGEPNNVGEEEDCVNLKHYYFHQFNDMSCESKSEYICEAGIKH